MLKKNPSTLSRGNMSLAELERPTGIVELAVRLADLGYYPVPIPRGSKGPVIDGWQHLKVTSDNAADYFTPEHGVGILHKNVLALDIDVYDADLASQIIAEAKHRFPGALERIGQAPKSALFFRMAEPGFKATSTKKRRKGDVTAQVEVRSVSRQIVVYGIHPDTKQPYKWPDGELWATPWEDLPEADTFSIVAFRDWCDALLKEWSGEKDQQAQIIDFGTYSGGTFGDEKSSEETFLAALDYVSANIGYEEWCGILMGIHDYYGGSARGLEVAKQYSSPYPDFNPREVEIKWRSFEAGKGITYKSVFHAAKQAGCDLSELARKERRKEAQKSLTPTATSNKTETQRDPEHDDTGPAEWPTPFDDFDAASIEPRQWIYAHHYLRGFVSVLASAGGIGKTSLQIVEALAIVTGRPLLGEAVKQQCNVWIINLEDPLDEMKRRILAAMQHYGITPDEVRGKLFVDAGRDFVMKFATQTRDGVIPNTALVEHMKQKIPQKEIGCVFLDPFVGAHEVNENDNMAVNSVVGQIREIADTTKCGFGLVHHIRKGNGQDADIDSVRGAGSLIGAARAARVINKVSEKDAESLGIPQKDAIGVFRVDDGKANLAPPASAALYRRMIGVQILNGEWVGVASAFDLPDEWSGMTEQVINSILAQIDAGMKNTESEEYYSLRPQDKSRWVGQLITDYQFSKAEDFKSEGQAKMIIKTWLANGLIEEITYHSATQRKDRKGVISAGRVGEQK